MSYIENVKKKAAADIAAEYRKTREGRKVEPQLYLVEAILPGLRRAQQDTGRRGPDDGSSERMREYHDFG